MVGSPQDAKRYFTINIITNGLVVAVSMAVNLYLTPFLLKRLGVAAYGIIALVISFVTYSNLVTSSISAAVSRFVTITWQKNRLDQSCIHFNSALVALVTLLAGGLLIVTGLAYRFASIFNVPPGFEQSAGRLFFLVMLSTFLLSLSSPFQVSAFITHRFYVSNGVAIASKLLRLALTVGLFTFAGTRLEWFGLAYVMMVVFHLAGTAGMCRWLTPQLRIQPTRFRWWAIRQITRMSGWIVVNQVGALLYISFTFVIINVFLGSEAVGRYGPIAQLAILLSALGGSISNVLTPIAFDYIAKNQIAALGFQMRRAVKFLALIIGLPVALLCGLAKPILHWWLGGTFPELAPLVSILMVPWMVSVAVRPLNAVFRGLDKVAIPGVVTLVGGVLNVGLSILLIRVFGWGLYGVGWALLICLGLKNFVFVPIYASALMHTRRTIFMRAMAPAMIASAGVALVGVFISRTFAVETLPGLLLAGAVLTVLYMALAYGVFLDTEERRFLIPLLLRRSAQRPAGSTEGV